MSVDRTPWSELPAAVHTAIRVRLRGSYDAHPVDVGANSGTAAVLTTARGARVFVKGQNGRAPRELLQPAEHPDDGSDWWGAGWGPVDQLGEEVRINPYLPASSPTVLWRVDVADWHLVGFDYVGGRHADYGPDSPDLDAVTRALAGIAACPTPPIPLPTAVDRWGYYCERVHRPSLVGGTLLHTDPASVNVLICEDGTDGEAHFVDWAWPAVGAPYIDTALWGMRLVAGGGHTPASAAAWVTKVPGWERVEIAAIRAFARAEANRWADLADSGTPGADTVVDAAIAWADYWA
ncbi:aminoglycoside phosphotransferase [Streptomycetaceae bacterium NBC_01309]